MEDLKDLAYEYSGAFHTIYFGNQNRYKVTWTAHHLNIKVKATGIDFEQCIIDVLEKVNDKINLL